MGLLLLVRHGQASLGAADYDQLSPTGHRQAQLTGARLAQADLAADRVVCGSLVRQRDTAEAAMTELGLPGGLLRFDDRLDEYDHTGVLAAHTSAVSFEGATTAEANRAVQPALEEAIARWAAAGGGYGESHSAFINRVLDAFAALTAEPGSTLAVTSGGVIAVTCTHLLGLPPGQWPALARVVVNGSITKVITGRTGTHLLTFNDHAHLEGDRALITYR